MGDILKYSTGSIYAPGTSFSSGNVDLDTNNQVINQSISNVASRMYNTDTAIGYELNRLGDREKYEDVGLKPSLELLRAQREGNLEKVLADSQSNLQKTRNALAQTLVSEIGIGTVKGITDLGDMVINLFMDEEQDYTNPVSAFLAEKQEEFNNYMPIYNDPTRNTLADGGLGNWGWWMNNMPSIMSSLTLMIPGEGITMGLSKLGNLAKVGKLGKGIRKGVTLGRRAVGGIENAERLENMVKLGISAGTSRLVENYQEANQVYQDMYKDAADTFRGMTQEEYDAWVGRHKDEFGEDVDMTNKDAVAKKIAKNSADETFKDDLWNTIFDVYELYALKNVMRVANAPLRSEVRRAQRESIRYIGLDAGKKAEALKNRTFGQKAIDKLDDWFYGGRTAISAELSEGVEEAVNYIAQQEGMHLGNVILEKEKDNDFIQHRLSEYMLAPELWDSALWGVLGGVVFQGLGSQVKKLENVIDVQTDPKYKKNDKTKEEINKPSWIQSWLLPESKMRIEDIENRSIKINNAAAKIKQIKDGEYKKADGTFATTEADKDVARQDVFNELVTDVLLEAHNRGNYDLAKEFFGNDKVAQFLVDNSITTQENAQATKETILNIATKIDELYNKNFTAIDNALQGVERRTGVALEDIPIDYIKLVARANIKHQLNADNYRRNAARIEQDIDNLEQTFEQELEGRDYRSQIDFVVSVANYANAVKELDKLENSKDADTLTGQRLIKEQREIVENLKNYVSRNVSGNDTGISRVSRYLSAYAQRRRMQGELKESPRRRELSKEFRKIDEAILNRDLTTLQSIDDVFSTLSSGDELESAIHQANVLNQNIEQNLSDNNSFYTELSQISDALARAYAKHSDYTLAAEMEESRINLTRDRVLNTIDNVHNVLMSERGFAIENANETIKRLAKRYGHEEILSYINNRFVQQGGVGYSTYYVAENIPRMTDDHKRRLDDAIDILNISSPQNINIAEQIKNVLELSAAENYATIKDIDYVESEDITEETGESSTISENPSETPKKSTVEKVSPKEEKSFGEPSSTQIGRFNTDRNGNTLSAPLANISINDKGEVTLNQVSAGTPEDMDVPIIYGDNQIEIDLKTLHNSNPSHKIFTTEELVNLDGNTTLSDGIIVTENPVLTLDEDGNVIKVHKGQVRKENESEIEVTESEFISAAEKSGVVLDDGFIETAKDYGLEAAVNSSSDDAIKDLYDKLKRGEAITSSSTGETTEPIINSVSETTPSPETSSEDDSTARVGEQEYDDSTVDTTVYMTVGEYIESNGTYDENAIKDIIRNENPNIPEDALDRSIIKARNWARKRAERRGNQAVIKAIDDLVMASDILDKAVSSENNTDKAKENVDKAFKAILKEYAKHCALDKYGDITYINLTNLLSYLNSATGNEYTAEVLYQNILRIIQAEGSKYRIVDGKLSQDEIIERSKMSKEELSEVLSNDSIQRINLSSFLNYLRETIGNDEEYNKTREEILNIVETAKVGDKLEYSLNNNRIEIKLKDTVIGSMPLPNINSTGTHYIMINEGWRTDVPMSDKANSDFYNLMERLFTNPNDEEDVSDIIREILIASHTFDNAKFNAKADYIIERIKNLKNSNAEALMTDKNNNGKDQYSNSDRVRHLIKLFNYIKTLTDKELIATPEALEQRWDQKELRRMSLNNWMNKLKNSYDSLRALTTNPNLEIEIASITEGGVIRTEENHPISEAIGEQHKGNIQLAISSITNPGVIHVSGSQNINDATERPGRTHIVINSRRQWLTNAFPAKFSSDNFKDTEAGKIAKEVIDEIDKVLNRWGENPTKTDLSELEDLLKVMTSRANANQPLFTGVRITKNSDNNHLNVEFDTDKGKYYVNFWNISKYDGKTSTGSNVEIIDPNGAKIVKGTSYLYADNKGTRKDNIRKQVLDLFNQALAFNLNPYYVISDNNRTLVLNGMAKRNKDGKFTIKIGNNEEHIFDSYSDFIIGNNTVNVNTMQDSNGKNVYTVGEKGNINFRIKDNTISPVEEIPTSSSTSVRNLGDKAIQLIESGRENVGLEILKLVLNDSELKNLKKSKILEEITPKNVIFVKNYNHIAAYNPTTKTINGVTVPAGAVIISDKFIELLNSKSENAAEEHFEAIRHLIHEGIHDLLTRDGNKKAVDAIREIFDDFVEANKSLPEKQGIRIFEFNWDENAEKRYYTDGKINLKGLEEFLVESLTRPALMQRLNEISQNNRKVGSERKISTAKGNLFQRLLSVLADLLGIKINKNSLLSKEYEIFRGLTSSSNISSTGESYEQLKLNFEEREEEEVIPKTEEKVEVEEKVEEKKEDKYDFGDNAIGGDEWFSDISDNQFSSSKSIKDKLGMEESTKFQKMLDNGLIKITCK